MFFAPFQLCYGPVDYFTTNMPLNFMYFQINQQVLEGRLQQEKKQGNQTGQFTTSPTPSSLDQTKMEKRTIKAQQNLFRCEIRKNEASRKPKKERRANQNKLRNVIPNIVHQIFSFITRQKRSRIAIQKYASTPKANNFNKDRYYIYQKLLKQKINNYLNLDSLKMLNQFQQPQFSIYSESQQINFIRVNRILVKYFLEHEFQNIILTSYRMNKQTRIWNMEMKRYILKKLKDIFMKI